MYNSLGYLTNPSLFASSEAVKVFRNQVGNCILATNNQLVTVCFLLFSVVLLNTFTVSLACLLQSRLKTCAPLSLDYSYTCLCDNSLPKQRLPVSEILKSPLNIAGKQHPSFFCELIHKKSKSLFFHNVFEPILFSLLNQFF